jgi:peroxiredoxin Q/BCP
LILVPGGQQKLPKVVHIAQTTMGLGIGDRLPNFSVEDQNGDQRSSESVQGRWLVLFFYPKTTRQVARLRPVVSGTTAAILQRWTPKFGVSVETMQVSHRRFAERHSLSFPLLCDRNNALRRQMGVPKALGMLPGRVTYVVDPTGVIRHTFSNLLDGPAHVREAERVLKELQS